MSAKTVTFELPSNLERYLAALSKLYAQDGERELQEIVVNAQTRVDQETSYDNWNGGIYGHTVHIVLLESLFLRVAKKRDALQKRLREDLNSLHNKDHEFFDDVFLELENVDGGDWRQTSGLLLAARGPASPSALKRIWGSVGYRVFLSHKSKVRRQAAALKEQLAIYGVSAFVAHRDIQPTKEWQDEIESALVSADALLALMTEDFHESDWTDQEVGFAFARGIPVVPVNLGRNPYGFIGKFQALPCGWNEAPAEIVRVLITKGRMLSAYIEAVKRCANFNDGNLLAGILPSIGELSDEQADLLIEAYNENSEVRGSFGFNGSYSQRYGDGLLVHLSRLNARSYELLRSGRIRVST